MADARFYDADHRSQGQCPHCHGELIDVLPLDPVFKLKTAAGLIPCSIRTLEKYLSAHADKLGSPLYKQDTSKRFYRYLTARDIRTLRELMFWTRDADGKMVRMSNVLRAYNE